MAVVTKYYLMEQVKILLAGGTPSAGNKYEPKVIWAFMQQVINKKLKIEHLTVTLPNDETIPEGLVLASYEDVPVETYKNKSRAKLPAMPVYLRRNMGIFHVGPTNDLDIGFIPLQSGQFAHLKVQKLINGILGNIGYEPPRDGYIIFTEDLTTRAIPITEVFMSLVVMDFDKYSDYDMLPMSADMGDEVVTLTYQKLLQTPPQEAKVSSTEEEDAQKR